MLHTTRDNLNAVYDCFVIFSFLKTQQNLKNILRPFGHIFTIRRC